MTTSNAPTPDRFRATGEPTHRLDGSIDTAAYIRALTIETTLVDIEMRVLNETQEHA